MCFGSLFDSPGQQLKRELLMSGVGAFVRWSLALGGSVVGRNEKN